MILMKRLVVRIDHPARRARGNVQIDNQKRLKLFAPGKVFRSQQAAESLSQQTLPTGKRLVATPAQTVSQSLTKNPFKKVQIKAQFFLLMSTQLQWSLNSMDHRNVMIRN